ncbi:MAG: haloacid dehalogenase type II [Aigarchaeota archaeon]|nr:haloacid dehalogenase type II [Candidatus Pelearchaeum maunauluense]
MTITALSFDCYGTLIDWEKGMRDAFQRVISRRSLTVDVEQMIRRYIEIELEVEGETYRKYKDVLRISTRRLLEEMDMEPSADDENVLVETLPRWPPFPETRETLKSLREKGLKLIILSNVDDDLIKGSVELIGVEFDDIITAEQTRSYKPAYGHWLRMLEAHKLEKEQVIHVSASYVHDIIPASRLGFRTVWINRKNETPRGRPVHSYEFPDLSPLPTLF